MSSQPTAEGESPIADIDWIKGVRGEIDTMTSVTASTLTLDQYKELHEAFVLRERVDYLKSIRLEFALGEIFDVLGGYLVLADMIEEFEGRSDQLKAKFILENPLPASVRADPERATEEYKKIDWYARAKLRAVQTRRSNPYEPAVGEVEAANMAGAINILGAKSIEAEWRMSQLPQPHDK